jgi:hypothetical protein
MAKKFNALRKCNANGNVMQRVLVQMCSQYVAKRKEKGIHYSPEKSHVYRNDSLSKICAF